jgi:anti-sigma factor RsiW
MTCTMHGRGFDLQVDDYVDGTLPAPARAALEAHLAICPACRMLASDLHAIRVAALTLERHVPPPRIWGRLAAIHTQARPPLTPGWLGAWQPLASAAAAVLLATGLWWVGDGLTPEDGARVAANAPYSGYPDALAAAYRDAEEQYATAITGLERITASEQAALDPDTAGVLRANLTVIDEAIVESRTALRNQPESDLAQESLFEALRYKVALLQDTLALINEMRKGNEEGAARIISGLNQ